MTAQYAGRLIDIYAWATPEGMISPSSGGKIVTGIIKLAQRWLITFFNEEDTVKYDYFLRRTQRGTPFLTRIREGSIQTEADLRALFALSEIQARQQMFEEETSDDPDDERYDGAELIDLEIGQGNISMTVTLRSRADFVELIVPIPIVV